MKKLLCILFSAVILLSFSACTKSELEGTWQAKITYAQLTEGQITSGFGKYEEYLKGLDSVSLRYTYKFESDGTYSEKCDTKSFLNDMNEILKSGITAYYTDYIKENKLNISLAEAMATDGITFDDLIDESVISSYTARQGNYKTEDGKLYLSENKNSAIDEAVYTEYKLSGKKLTLQKSVGASFSVASMLPLTLTKIG